MYATLVIFVLLLPIPIYFVFKLMFKDRQIKKGMQAVKEAYKRVKKRHMLSISEVNRFGNRLIAIDRGSGKLVLIVYKDGITWEKCFGLDEIMLSRIVKVTDKESGGIKKVILELTLADDQEVVTFSFFDEQTDKPRDLSYNLKRSKSWKRKIQCYLSTFQTSHENRQFAAVV